MKVKDAFDHQIDKFKVYCLRNLFTASQSDLTAGATPDSPRVALEKQTLRSRQHQYSLMSAEFSKLTAETAAREALLKDMLNASFTLRVGTQAFEELEVSPVVVTMESIVSARSKLQQICVDSKGMQ